MRGYDFTRQDHIRGKLFIMKTVTEPGFIPGYTYEDALAAALAGTPKDDRTGTGTISATGLQIKFNMTDQSYEPDRDNPEVFAPAVTTKKLAFKSAAVEFAWMFAGRNDVDYLTDKSINGVASVGVWDAWRKEDGTIGKLYGYQWRNWETELGSIDQVEELISGILTDPFSRRHIVSNWNVADLNDGLLYPCVLQYQFIARPGSDGEPLFLDLVVNQRSADMFLGVPWDLYEAGLFLAVISEYTGLVPGTLVWNGGDCHVYKDHVDQVCKQLSRRPYSSPRLLIGELPADGVNIDPAVFTMDGYKYHPALSGRLSV